MNKMEDPSYKAKICKRIGLIERAIDGLTETEISAAVCAAITKVLVDKELRPVQIKRFYAELAAVAIERTDCAYLYRGFKDDTN